MAASSDMPTRIIRDGILTSERVNALSERAELFYRRLMSVVDDHGRYTANPTLLRASCYPLKLDCMKEDSIRKHLAEAEGAGLIVLYMVSGKPYLQILDFGQRVQSKSKYPEPTDGEMKLTVIHGGSPEKTALDGVVVEDEVGLLGAAPATPASPPVVSISLNDGSDYHFSEEQVRELSGLYPAADVLAELRKMQGWAIANPTRRKTRSGLLRFATSWLSKEQDKGRPQTANPQQRRRNEL